MVASPTHVEDLRSLLDSRGNPLETAAKVKSIVTDQLESLDSALRVKHTDYFNHTFVPDLVVWWKQAGSLRSREVFLRSDLAAPGLPDDISALGSPDRVFYGLRESPEVDEQSTDEEAQEADARGALVTESAAIAELQSEPVAGSVGQLLGGEVVRGGQGLVDAESAAELQQSVGDGFNGLMVQDAEAVQAAVDALDEYLQPEASSRLQGYMRFIWWASGGDPTDFPGRESSHLSDGEVVALLRFLFSQDEIEDEPFWTKVGDVVLFRHLGDLGTQPSSVNLAHFMRVNAQSLQAKCLRLSEGEAKLPIAPEDFRWRVQSGTLTLESDAFDVPITENMRKFRGVERNRRLPRWETLRDRLAVHRLWAIAFEDPRTSVIVRSKDVGSLTDADNFEALAQSAGENPLVQSIVYGGAGGVPFECEYDRATVNASVALSVSDLVLHGIDSLVGLTDEARVALAAVVGAPLDDVTDGLVRAPEGQDGDG